MTIETARDLMQAWLKEVAHADFRYLSDDAARFLTGALHDQLTAKWKKVTPSRLICQSCGKEGFKTLDVWSIAEKSRLKCGRCGEWASVDDWDAKTTAAREAARK